MLDSQIKSIDKTLESLQIVRDQLDSATYRTLPLSRGLYALVDPWRYDELSAIPWHADWPRLTGSHIYAATNLALSDGRTRTVRLHRYVLGLLPTRERMHSRRLVIDHVNDCTLDCREDNLQTLTASQNLRKRYMEASP